MKKLRLFSIMLFFLSTFAFAEKINFSVTGILQRDAVSVALDWDEKWFGKSATIYNHNIARIACVFSDVSYIDVEKNKDDNALLNNYKALGIKNSDIEIKYNIDYSDPLYGNDQCAFSLATKEINSSKGKKSLVFVVIRGTPLNANEWLSNLNISDDTKTQKIVHEGFARAAQQVHIALISFLLRHKIEPENSYFLITGHSRGAAVANLLSSMAVYEDFFDTEKMYTYTFASPNVTTSENATDEKYNYIHNIVNAEDIVPTVPLYKDNWTFRKYGKILTLVNYWNISQSTYTDEILPKVNEFHRLFIGREYFPFKTGPFIPVQITNIVNKLNSSVDDFYSGPDSLHNMGSNVFTKIFPEPKDNNKADDVGDGVSGDGVAEANVANGDDNGVDGENEKKHETFFDRVRASINKKHNGLFDYMMNAFNDMHDCGMYLSFMIGLDEKEAFSTQGFSQLIVKGQEEFVAKDKAGHTILRVIDGNIVFSSIRLPIAAMPVSFAKIAVGFPENLDFDFYVTNESLINTGSTFILEHYDEKGHLIESGEKQKIYTRMNAMQVFSVGEITKNEKKFETTKLKRDESKKLTIENRLLQEQQFRVLPELSVDTDFNLLFGAKIGSQHIYGTTHITWSVNSISNFFAWSLGFGTGQTLWGPILVDAEVRGKMLWAFIEKTDNEKLFNFVPELRLTFSVRPIRHIILSMSALFDFYINNLNDAAFDKKITHEYMGKIPFGDDFGIVPTLLWTIGF